MKTCAEPRGRAAGRRGVPGILLVCLCACVSLWFAAVAGAQQGHPLVGTWRGEWGPSAAQRHDLTVVMEYDGTNVTGTINPGFESMKLQKVTLDPSTWTVRFESEAKDASGAVVPVVIEATIQDVTSPERSLVGTWTQGTVKGDFKISLDS